MSPEIINDPQTTSRGEADYWALGVIIYLIYTKKLPFAGDTPYDVFDNILEYNVDWVALESSKIDKDLLEITRKLLTYDQKKRIEEIKTIRLSPYFKGKINY